MRVCELCDHFEQRELAKESTWRSHAMKNTHRAYQDQVSWRTAETTFPPLITVGNPVLMTTCSQQSVAGRQSF